MLSTKAFNEMLCKPTLSTRVLAPQAHNCTVVFTVLLYFTSEERQVRSLIRAADLVNVEYPPTNLRVSTSMKKSKKAASDATSPPDCVWAIASLGPSFAKMVKFDMRTQVCLTSADADDRNTDSVLSMPGKRHAADRYI